MRGGKSIAGTAETSYGAFASSSKGGGSFPEVVSFLSNPFQKNNLNYAVKNQQAIITPRMATTIRLQRAYKGDGQSSNSSHAGLKL